MQIESKFFPFTQIFAFEGANFDGISKKIYEFNEELKDNAQAYLLLKEHNLFNDIIETLKDVTFYHSSKFTDQHYNVIEKLLNWPMKYLVPVLDLFRVLLTHHGAERIFAGLDSGVSYITFACQVLRSDANDVLTTMALKFLTNLFKNNNSRYSALKFVDILLDSLDDPKLYQNPKVNLRTAYSSVILNISICAESGRITDDAVARTLALISKVLPGEQDGGILMRYLVSVGNLLLKYVKMRDVCIKCGLADNIKNLQVPASADSNVSECLSDLQKLLNV